MRDYGKVHTSFWSSDTIRSLSEDGRMLALYLMTSPHTTITGTFRLPDGYACEDLGWSAERVSEGFEELFANGFANRCETTKWVWICKHLEWNPPENPNQRKSAAKMALSVPDSCDWKAAFLCHSGPLIGLQDSNPCETLAEPFVNQKQEQEQEQKQEKERVASPTPSAKADLFADVSPQVVADFKKLRRAKKAEITETAVAGIRREAKKAGLSLEAVMAMCCERGWAGFKAEWLLRDGGHAPPQSAPNSVAAGRKL